MLTKRIADAQAKVEVLADSNSEFAELELRGNEVAWLNPDGITTCIRRNAAEVYQAIRIKPLVLARAKRVLTAMVAALASGETIDLEELEYIESIINAGGAE